MAIAKKHQEFSPLRGFAELESFIALRGSLSAPLLRATGLWSTSKALLIATLSTELRRPIMVVSSTPRATDRLEDELEAFLCPATPLPAYDVLPGETETPEMPVLSARLSALKRLSITSARPPIVVAPVAAILQPFPKQNTFEENGLALSVNQEFGHTKLVDWLSERGLERVGAVSGRGEFVVRGGIIDIFPLYSDSLFENTESSETQFEEFPVRVEFDDDKIESIRAFDPVTQRSVQNLEHFHIPGIERADALMPYLNQSTGQLADYLRADTIIVVLDPLDVAHHAELYQSGIGKEEVDAWSKLKRELAGFTTIEVESPSDDPITALPETLAESTSEPSGASNKILSEQNDDSPEAISFAFETKSVLRLYGKVDELANNLKEMNQDIHAMLIYCRDDTERSRIKASLKRTRFKPPEYFEIKTGHITEGFSLGELGLVVLAAGNLLGVKNERRRIRKTVKAEPIGDFLELTPGDYVVHSSNGIARYCGITRLEKEGGPEDYLTLMFKDRVKLYVSAGNSYLVERFIGAGTGAAKPALSKLGGAAWSRKKARVAKAIVSIASDLLATQAARNRSEGIAYPKSPEWEDAFDASFPFEETADQLAAARAIRSDMERPVPMDRLLCGDVGFGKTEVAMRAAFKAASAGRQVAMLVPTTLLAEQHGRTFQERFRDYPIRVEAISRFRKKAEQKQVLLDLTEGKVDILIGTHRMLSKDVKFPDLGLVIIDEEHRFGVEHKERLKRMRVSVDVLSLSATPIPRTMHMSIIGLRDISTLSIPPEDRLSIRTKVCKMSNDLVRRSILREIARGGQVYFVHDRVMDIENLTARLKQIVPEARFETVHGQMNEKVLSGRMAKFLHGIVDVLVTTTIIESGIDVPTANTIFIHNADHFGLAELHQLRGRVGRYKHQAYAYLMPSENKAISTDAEKRLRAVEEFEELGAGFKVAMRDLEIRGAGSLLGKEQSGQIIQIGYELYCRLLEQAVNELQGRRVAEPVDVTLALGWGASMPLNYVAEESIRLEIYRKLARAKSSGDVTKVKEEMRDRFGVLPVEALRVLAETRLRILAQKAELPFVGREMLEKRGRLTFKLRSMNFKQLETKLKGLPGQFGISGPEGFYVELPEYMLRTENLEKTASNIIKQLI